MESGSGWSSFGDAQSLSASSSVYSWKLQDVHCLPSHQPVKEGWANIIAIRLRAIRRAKIHLEILLPWVLIYAVYCLCFAGDGSKATCVLSKHSTLSALSALDLSVHQAPSCVETGLPVPED